MTASLREELATKPILLRIEREKPKEYNGMLCLNEKQHFEFAWNGVGEDGRLVGAWSNGYLAFNYIRPMPYMHVVPEQITTYPPEIIFARDKDLVETNIYDRIKIRYQNIFTGFKHNLHDPKAIDLLQEIEREPVYVRGLRLKIFIGGSSSGSRFPLRAEYVLDTLVVQLTGKGKIHLSDVNSIVDTVTKVVTLYTCLPADPLEIELGLQSELSDSMYDYAHLEHSKPYKYASLARKFTSGLEVQDHAASFIDSISGALTITHSRELGIWFSFTEADYNKYYLDTIMSNLLSCAERVFCLLPKRDTTKREKEFDDMLVLLDQIDIKPSKLKKFITNAKNAYIDPITYETKILELIKYSEIEVVIKKDLAKYANQLRNNLMHGTEPNWDYIVDGDRRPVKEIHILEHMRTLRAVVAAVLKKHLSEQI